MGCQRQDEAKTNYYSIVVIDGLDIELNNFLEQKGVDFVSNGDGTYSVAFESSALVEMSQLITDFYKYMDQPLVAKNVYQEEKIVYCCHFEGAIIPYLEKISGAGFLEDTRDKIRSSIEEYHHLLNCPSCEFAVEVSGQDIFIRVMNVSSGIERERLKNTLGFGMEAPPSPFNLRDITMAKLRKISGSAHHYLINNVRVVFDE